MSFNSIVDADIVYTHHTDPHWRIVDCHYNLQCHDEGLDLYRREHIPNAVYAHLKNDLASPSTPTSGRHPLPDIEKFKRLLGSWGINQQTQVVVYDNANGSFAARLWWLLKWLGHSKVAVLDGGFNQWKLRGYPVTSDIPHYAASQFAGRPDMTMLVSSNEIAMQLPKANITLIDVRDPERYYGVTEPIDNVAGHIPNAINVPWKTNLDSQGRFLPRALLTRQYRHLLHQQNPQQTVFMCGSGVTACHSLVALAFAGIEGARLYAGSWSEWITDPERPIQTDKP